MALSFQEARAAVIRELTRATVRTAPQPLALDEAAGLYLAQPITADRDQPPFDRVTRDGFAVRAAEVSTASAGAPVVLRVVGEALPGQDPAGPLQPGTALEIMTGAPLPIGADAVVMVEHTARTPDGAVSIHRPVVPGENVVPRGSELGAGAVACPAGRRLDPALIGLLASLGVACPVVHGRPRVALVSTGDELVEIDQRPAPAQIRNSNRHTLAAQVRSAGAVPRPAPIARDSEAALRGVLQAALVDADLLLLSGGVSMGKYDFVEPVLASLGATVVFDAVAIRPGKPLVFGFVGAQRPIPFFGLPGNPLSTLVTFELFVRPALALLAGGDAPPFRPWPLPLAAEYTQRPLPLTAFVPAALTGDGPTVQPLPSQGSGDLAAMARADCLMVVPPQTALMAAGALVGVLPKPAVG